MSATKPAAVLALPLLLAACGGGGGAGGDGGDGLVVIDAAMKTAQGYASDAQTMPAASASGLQTATRSLEVGLALASLPGSSTTLTTACPGGGTVRFSISGGTFAQQRNGRLDAGEVYDITFSACAGSAAAGTPGATLDGGLTLTVAAYSDTAADLTHAARALVYTTAQGRNTLDGSVREQRSTVAAGSGQRYSSRLSSGGLALASAYTGGRSASYELRALDWTVVSTTDAGGALLSRTHQGTLTLAVSSPRRPTQTLQVTTQGTLAAGSDGLVAQGSFRVATSQDAIAVAYDDTLVRIELDLGNNGSVDRRWSITRGSFADEAS